MKPQSNFAKAQGATSNDSCAPSVLSVSSVANSFRLPPRALTLIELLVVIVILTTLVGGVIPILSPNNDVRKIQVAARGLQGYITQVQAEAARTGRPQGIAFRESSPASGVALEVFGLEVPPPFAGFSTESRVRVDRAEDVVNDPTVDAITYGPINGKNLQGNTRTQFSPEYFGYDLYRLRFELAASLTVLPAYSQDLLPPRMFKIGDVIDVGGNQFLIVDDDRQIMPPFATSTEAYVDPDLNLDVFSDSLICVWINNSGQLAPQGLKHYLINRQPTNSSESPYQLPSGIVIDMQASIAEGSDSVALTYPRFPLTTSFYSDRSAIPTGDPIPTDTIGIMFSPTGAVDSVILNGSKLTSISRVVLLLGRIENGGIDPVTIDLSKSDEALWTVQTGEKIEDVQERINWLNLDSRLLSIIANNGRVIVSEPAFVDPLSPINQGNDDGETAEFQLEAAHAFAHEMTTAK